MNLQKYLSKKPRGAKASFALEIGISRSFLRQIETGRSKCPIPLAKKIEEATDGVVSRTDLRPDVYD